MSLLDRWFGGHIHFWGVTVYGRNAMHWGVTVQTRRWGYVCFRLPFRCYGCWWPLYFYVSPNATPWASTFMIGRAHDPEHCRLASVRRHAFGHNFDTEQHIEQLGLINGWTGRL